LTVRDFKQETRINKRYNIVATYATSGTPDNSFTTASDQEFIAILENPDFPLYIMTYDVYFTQFVHIDPTKVDADPIDRSIACRKHAQFIAK
jgi:hypothetical protein